MCLVPMFLLWLTLSDCVSQGEGHPHHYGHTMTGLYKMEASDMAIAAGDVIASNNEESLSDCAISCTSNDNCYSFSYSDQSKMCELTQQWYKEYAPNAMVVNAGTDVYSGKTY